MYLQRSRCLRNGPLSKHTGSIVSHSLMNANLCLVVGGGFFTMKHKFVNVRDELDQMYKEYDSFAVYRLVYDEIDRLNQHYYDNFFAFNRDTP